MTRLVSFTDGFTSSSAPSVSGSSPETYTIANNTTANLFTIDGASYSSAFIEFELERIDVSNEYRQSGTIILNYDGANWLMEVGNYIGDDIVQTTNSLAFHVDLSISTSTGVGTVAYTSGTMGASYSGSLKLFITRISA